MVSSGEKRSRRLGDERSEERDVNVCRCLNPDLTKDPNCHNSRHDHHDPESHIVTVSEVLDGLLLFP